MAEFLLKSDIAEIAQRLGEASRDFSGKTVLLTGGRGFLGRYFMDVFAYLNEHVLEQPCRLVALDNLITAGKEGAEVPDLPNVTFVNHDVIEPFQWEGPLHYVIHAAGIASPFYYRAYPLETLEVAVRGTRNMLELAQCHQARFTFFSSSEIYGDPDPKHVPTQESYRGNVSAQGPRACYDESKRVGETLCYIFHEKHGTATNTIRPFNVFGPGMQETDYRVLPNFANRIKASQPLNIYGSGNQTRTFCYITDAMVGFLLVILRGVPGEPYNIGNPKPEISMLELVKRIESVLGRKVAHNIIEYPDSYPADEPNRRCPDIRKARLQLKFEPSVDLNEGLRRFLTWADKVYTGEA
ncbi:NAD-dependent epimerase/dehydratase family protein [Magnetospirillum sp. UT-4]|uniref:NAD-dependent epimerase/dehydratase family protein n=1 Tax=Magnetospirillum sp. UT-4 TaxID=2681467 RepID=UPI0013853883|nr:NAD-dependent epimerase/dehydratase family protein [Magnetospirillum sp. UT-4]CAA7621653.1 NAD-dependent epimerase/dehydratase [Magnetospirillum sp. UT-4]